MKKRLLPNALIAGLVVAILYYFIGHDFLHFYTGGKEELLRTATQINERCNEEGTCPTALAGWTASGNRLYKGNMLYIVTMGEQDPDSGSTEESQHFKLIYRFFMPDSWFEARGGVGEKVNAGWVER